MSRAASLTRITERRARPICLVLGLAALIVSSLGSMTAMADTAKLPVVINVLKGTTQTASLDIPGILRAANRILGQADIELVQSGSVNYGVSDRGNNDGTASRAERMRLYAVGQAEVAAKGIKVFVGESHGENPRCCGVATHAGAGGGLPTPVVIVFPNQQTPSTTMRGNDLAHEVAHALTLGPGHTVAPGVSADGGGHVQTRSYLMFRSNGKIRKRGSTLTPGQIGEIQTGARRLGTVFTMAPGTTGSASRCFFQDPIRDVESPVADLSGASLVHDGLTDELLISADLREPLPGDVSIEADYHIFLDIDDDESTGERIGEVLGLDAVIEVRLRGRYPFAAHDAIEAVLVIFRTGVSQLIDQIAVVRTQELTDVLEPDPPPAPIDLWDSISLSLPFEWLVGPETPIRGLIVSTDRRTGETDRLTFSLAALPSSSNGETPGGDPPVFGRIVAFPTPERFVNEDLNGDGDVVDTVLQYKDLDTGVVVNTGLDCTSVPHGLDLWETIVAFSSGPDHVIRVYDIETHETHETPGKGYNPAVWGDWIAFTGLDKTIQLIDLDEGRLLYTGIIGSTPTIHEGNVVFAAGNPATIWIYDAVTGTATNTEVIGQTPAIFEDVIAFSTPEIDVREDLNGDGDLADRVIRWVDLTDSSVVHTGTVGEWPAIWGDTIVFSTREESVATDLNEDGYIGREVIQEIHAPSGQVTNTQHLGSLPDVYQRTISYHVREAWIGIDLSNDGDMCDSVVLTCQARKYNT